MTAFQFCVILTIGVLLVGIHGVFVSGNLGVVIGSLISTIWIWAVYVFTSYDITRCCRRTNRNSLAGGKPTARKRARREEA